ncbi:MAG TPA: helix-turn-helix domain-containing protein [Devosia sp.]|nr:helix-turn-helix domain-containing protein [Devosia sp.]
MQIQSSFRAERASGSGAFPASPAAGMQASAVTLYPTDATIYAQGDATGPLCLVEFGTVRICRMTADGRRQITGFLTAGDVFGFEAGSEHESCAESVDGAGVRVLRSAAGSEPTGAMLQMALRTLARTQHQLVLLGCRSANMRMAAFIADFSERQGDERRVRLSMQRNDIADYLGLTFETVSRTLRYLKDEGIIRLKSTSDIEILDRNALDGLCE